MTNHDHNDGSLLRDLANILIALAQSPRARRILWTSLRNNHPYVFSGAAGVVILMAICSPLVLLFPSGSDVITQATDHVSPQQAYQPQDPALVIDRLVRFMFGPAGYMFTGLLLIASFTGFFFGVLKLTQLIEVTVAHLLMINAAPWILALTAG